MDLSNEDIDKVTTSLSHILLPTCNEAEDVFFNVVKRIFSRSKYENNVLDNAFKFAMSGGVFQIEEEDLSMNWRQLDSEDQRIRQSKLLGFWAVKNFPSLGKQLCGPSWHVEVKSLPTNIHGKEISADETNAMIFKKLKLRVLKLNVSDSTLGKLKYFVKVPDTIAKRNEYRVSKKITAFDIDDQWVEHCWRALKLGGFSLAFEQQRDLIETLNQLESLQNRENGERKNGGNGSSSVTPKRPHQDTVDYNVNGSTLSANDESSIGSQTIQAPKRAYVDIVDVTVNDRVTEGISRDSSTASQPVLAPRANSTGGRDSSTDFQAAILYLRNDIGRLTDIIQSTIHERDSEIAIGQERLHIIVINQKDAEIAQLKATVQELRQVNDSLIKDQLKSLEQIEKQAALINVVQKGAEANFKLHEQSDRNLVENLNLIETMKSEIADAVATKKNLEDELGAANQTKDKLRDEVIILKEQTASLVTKLKTEMETLEANLAAAEQKNSDTINQNVNLKEELDALKRYAASKENEFHNVQKALVDSATTKQNMEDELGAANHTKAKLYDEVNILKDQTASLVIKLKAEMETLESNLTAAEQMNSDTIDQKVKLQEELDELKLYTVSKEDELENVQNSFIELQKQVDMANSIKSDVGTQTAIWNEMEKISAEHEMNGIEISDIKPNDSIQCASVQSVSILCGNAQGVSECLPRQIEEKSEEDNTIGYAIERSDMESNESVQSVNIQCDDPQGESEYQDFLPRRSVRSRVQPARLRSNI